MQKNSILFALALLSGITLLASCQGMKPTGIDDETKKEAIFNYNLDYSSQDPGHNYSLRYLWDGYDDTIIDGIPGSKDNRTSTFLNEYKDTNNYYLLYLSNKDLDTAKSYLKEKEKESGFDGCGIFSSFDDTNSIDGKYLYAAQQSKGNPDYFILEENDYKDAAKEIDGYTLVFVCKEKTVSTLLDATSEDAFTKETTAYCEVALKYDEASKTFSKTISDQYGIIDIALEKEGKVLEITSSSFKTKNSLYAPLFGIEGFDKTLMNYISADVVTIDEKDYVSLPRYAKATSSSTTIDLLGDDVPEIDDVYKDQKAKFLEALSTKEGDKENYSLFDLEKVKEIIVEGHKK